MPDSGKPATSVPARVTPAAPRSNLPQNIVRQQERLRNSLHANETRDLRRASYAIIVMLAGFAGLACVLKAPQIEHATGQTQPDQDIARIEALDSASIVKQILVKENQRVKKGDPLFVLSNPDVNSNVDALTQQIRSDDVHIAGLTAFISGASTIVWPPGVDPRSAEAIAEQNAFIAKRNENETKLAGAEAKLQRAIADEKRSRDAGTSAHSQIRTAQQQLERFRQNAANGFGGADRILDKDQEIKRLLGDAENYENQAKVAQSDISAARAAIDELKTTAIHQAQEDLVRTRNDRDQANAKLGGAEARKQMQTLSAPYDGYVQDISITTPGAEIAKGADPLARIVPLDATMRIDAKITPPQRKNIKVGQSALVSVSGFDPSTDGRLHGRVEAVSATSTTGQDKIPYFRVTIALDRPYYLINGTRVNLSAGQTADVQIEAESRTIMQYLLEPITRLSQNSLTER